ncbi:unnamed protein product [Arctia plantaginis]|uniref:Lipase domain-containing protein n=1 Tax=Arctia plantaginis TaxID=874455 RepID=A0A8S1A668_ARCPL|nr:unnamed protein product [Arctia plantaginis]
MLGLRCALILCATSFVTALELNAQDVAFHLFTSRTYPQSQRIFPNMQSIMNSDFHPLQRTIVTIHTNGETVAGNFNAFVVKAHVESADVNVIAVDWSVGSRMYTQGLGNAPQCGAIIADFINFFIVSRLQDVSLMRFVGVGLGAQVAGIAARNILGPVPHIVALDPALVGWTYNPHQLTKSDAEIVEVIHTTAGIQGYDYPLGDIDFYPNGGSRQNGCAEILTCSHQMSFVFYAESISVELTQGNRFVGTRCNTYEQAIIGECNGERDAIFGGIDAEKKPSGIYHFETNSAQPFARG